VRFPAKAQDVQERVIKFGHLNNADHPVSMGVKRFAELLAAKSGGKLKVQEFPASPARQRDAAASRRLQGGVQEMSAPATTSLAGIVKEFGLVDFPVLGRQFRAGRRASRRPARPGVDRQAPEKGLWRWATGTWAFATSPTASARSRGGGPGRPEAARHSQPGVPRDLQGVQGEPGADAFRRALWRARIQGGRWPGESLFGDPLEQVLRGEQVRERHQPCLRGEHHPGEQEVLGSPVAGGAEDDERRGERARPYQREASRAAAQKAVAELQAKGMQFNEVSAAEQARMRDIAKPVVEKFAASYDPAIVKLYNSELARVRK
jgi:hypothetical protein